jgi:hypothetical protein
MKVFVYWDQSICPWGSTLPSIRLNATVRKCIFIMEINRYFGTVKRWIIGGSLDISKCAKSLAKKSTLLLAVWL